jgi:hypothetical protein
MLPFWPDMTLPTDTKDRVGRVLFWIGVIIAAPFLLGAIWTAAVGKDFALAIICLAFSAVSYGIGRGMVYILADE